jgi:hypothetical protein
MSDNTLSSAICRLEMIISETSNKEGPHLDVDEHNPEGVYFTAHK